MEIDARIPVSSRMRAKREREGDENFGGHDRTADDVWGTHRRITENTLSGRRLPAMRVHVRYPLSEYGSGRPPCLRLRRYVRSFQRTGIPPFANRHLISHANIMCTRRPCSWPARYTYSWLCPLRTGRINAPLLHVNTSSSSVSAIEIKCSLGGNRRSEVSTHFEPRRFLFSARRSLLRTERLANK